MTELSRDEKARFFQFPSMAENYKYRPPYPIEFYDTLLDLLNEPAAKRVLDIGCGPGKISRGLVENVEQIDAVDFSSEMIEVGRKLPNGNHPNLNWVCSRVEGADLTGPYGLVAAGASIHWFDHDILLPKIKDLLDPKGYLVVADGDSHCSAPWAQKEWDLMAEYHMKTSGIETEWIKNGYRPNDCSGEMLSHPCFRRVGVKITKPIQFSQTIEDYISCLLSRQSFCREAGNEKALNEFDRAIESMLENYLENGRISFEVATRIEWGRVDL